MVEREVLDAAIARLTPAPGTYALGLRLPRPGALQIGALGFWQFPAGDYVYVGSAWGPGGLAARVGRHLRGDGKPHWHIDTLRPHTSPITVWAAPQVRRECDWAAVLLKLPSASVIVPRFGASDCRCAAHLIYVGAQSLGNSPLPDASIQIALKD